MVSRKGSSPLHTNSSDEKSVQAQGFKVPHVPQAVRHFWVGLTVLHVLFTLPATSFWARPQWLLGGLGIAGSLHISS